MSRVSNLNSNGLRPKPQKHLFQITLLLIGVLLIGFTSSTVRAWNTDAGGFNDIVVRPGQGMERLKQRSMKDKQERSAKERAMEIRKQEEAYQEDVFSLCRQIKKDGRYIKGAINKSKETQLDGNSSLKDNADVYKNLYVFLKKYYHIALPEQSSEVIHKTLIIIHDAIASNGEEVSFAAKKTAAIGSYKLSSRLYDLRREIRSFSELIQKKKMLDPKSKLRNQKLITLIDKTMKDLSSTISITQTAYFKAHSELIESNNRSSELKDIWQSDINQLLQEREKLIEKHDNYVIQYDKLSRMKKNQVVAKKINILNLRINRSNEDLQEKEDVLESLVGLIKDTTNGKYIVKLDFLEKKKLEAANSKEIPPLADAYLEKLNNQR